MSLEARTAIATRSLIGRTRVEIQDVKRLLRESEGALRHSRTILLLLAAAQPNAMVPLRHDG